MSVIYRQLAGRGAGPDGMDHSVHMIREPAAAPSELA